MELVLVYFSPVTEPGGTNSKSVKIAIMCRINGSLAYQGDCPKVRLESVISLLDGTVFFLILRTTKSQHESIRHGNLHRALLAHISA